MPEFLRLDFTINLLWCMNYYTYGLSNYHVKSRLCCQWGERGRYLVKIIDIIGRVGLFCIFFVTVVGLTLSYLNKGSLGSGRQFGGPEIMVIAIIAIPSIGLIFLARWLVYRRKKMIIEATIRR
jgi:hypothetical protein